ncbi:MAG TPA: hypothetical protein VFY17_09630 [Pilimelia sp.]|nr:hypothetical protein [Pilimelia sp.]
MSPADRCAAAVRRWARAAAAGGAPPPFPFRQSTALVRAHGTNALRGAVPAALHDAAAAARGQDRVDWFTRTWLDALAARVTGAATYAHYVLTPVLDRHCRCGAGPDHQVDAARLAAALTADLVHHELRPDAAAHPRRVRAAVRLAADLHAALRPGGPHPGGGRAARRAPTAAADPRAARRTCRRLLSALAGGQGPLLRQLLAWTPLPATGAPDEYLFMRAVQVMEVLAWAAAAQARAAGTHRADIGEVTGRLAALAGNLRRATDLFPLLSTLDPAQFATVRAGTYGTGALQSPGFAALERHCRGVPALRPETVGAVGVDRCPVPHPALGETLRALRARLDPGAAARLAAHVDAVDDAWLRWKRAHCGVTRRLIGAVPGTGHTDGLAYLRRHAAAGLLAGDPPAVAGERGRTVAPAWTT